MEITGDNQHHLRYQTEDSLTPAWKPGYEQDEHEVLLFELVTDEGIPGVATASGFAGRMYWNDGLGFAANLHLLAATDAAWSEYPIEPPGWTPESRDFLLAELIVTEDGEITLPSGPGLRTELDWDLIHDPDEEAA
jgi:L-alanine-DL-glutamate epimerase-like enolase superfamily enzyme